MGDFAEEGHRDVGKYLADRGIDLLIAVGEMADWIALEAKKSGLKEENVFTVPTNKDAIDILKQNIRDNDAVLVKGSRGMTMEEIVRSLQGGS